MRPRRLRKSAKRFQLGIESLESRLLFSTYTVTSLADDGSSGTLRWAVQQASSDSGPDTINFQSGLTGTIALQGELEFTRGNTTVVGPGASQLAISGGEFTTDFRVDPLATVAFSGLSINDGADFLGSAIDNLGTVSVSDCVFNNNVSSGGQGGAIFDSGTLSVTDSTFSNNSASFGGAIYADGDTLTVAGCTFSGNSTDTDGGAIYANFASGNIVNSTFADNSTAGDGGAIYASGGSMILTNSTISANSATTDGGGIYVDSSNVGDVTLYNTIVAGNTLGDGVTPDDISGLLDQVLAGATPSSNNLIGTGGTGGLTSGTNSNLVGVANPGLGALANNGGLTETMAILEGSPAINGGSNALAVDTNGIALTTDQIGNARIQQGVVDIGAEESPYLPPPPPVQPPPVQPPPTNPPPTNPTPTDTLTVSYASGTDGKHVKLSATLLAADGDPLKNKTITFTLDGQTVGKACTNRHGVADLNVPLDVTPGDYATGVGASFAGNKNYAAVTATAALTVSDPKIQASCPSITTDDLQSALKLQFTQDRPGAIASDYSATIDWGDGSGAQAATVTDRKSHCAEEFVLSGSHTYAAVTVKTTYIVTITITDQYGATKTVEDKVTLTPPPAPKPSKSKHGH